MAFIGTDNPVLDEAEQTLLSGCGRKRQLMASGTDDPVLDEAEQTLLLGCGRKRQLTAPGTRFKAKVDGRWLDYAPHANEILKQAFSAGSKSVRFSVKGHLYKFNFVRMVQTNLNTMEVSEMRAPHNVARPTVPLVCDWGTVTAPLARGVPAVAATLQNRNVYVVPVPNGSAGTTIMVPHPRKLGKQLSVSVPRDASVGQPLFILVPRKIRKSTACAVSGVVGVGTGTVVALIVADEVAVGGAAVAAGGTAAAGLASVAPALVAGAAAAGAAALSAAAVHYATKNPGKAVAIGTLTIAGLAFADHVGEVGTAAAFEDVIQGAGDVFDAGQDVGQEVVDIFDFIRTDDIVEDDIQVAGDAFDAGQDAGQELVDIFDFIQTDQFVEDPHVDALLAEADLWLEDLDLGELAVDATHDFVVDLFQ